MKTEQQTKIENAIKAEIQLDMCDDDVDMLKVSDEEFEEYMLAHAQFKQTMLLKSIARDYAKTGGKWLLANVGVSAGLGLALASAHPMRPLHAASWAILTALPGIVYSVPKFDCAIKIGKLSRASQEDRRELVLKYLADDPSILLAMCENVIDGASSLENLIDEKKCIDARNATRQCTAEDIEERENLHREIVNQYLTYSDYCDLAWDDYVNTF